MPITSKFKIVAIKEYPNGGLFSNVNKTLEFLYHNQHFENVIWYLTSQNQGPFCYIKEGEELFSHIFEQYHIKLNDKIATYPNSIKEKINQIQCYKNREKLKVYNPIFNRYFKIKDDINDIVLRKSENFNENTIGILVRGDKLKNEQPTKKMPSLEKYLNAVKHLNIQDPNFFLSIDNMKDLYLFKHMFAPNYHTDIRRSKNNTIEPHLHLMGTEKDLIDSFVEVFLLSKCKYLIHPVSNMATTSLIMNNEQKSIFI